ncbi:MAG: acyl-CoA dehydrogenase family protein [Planctomycetaceae bacterium]|nr:acyl-CoA dehydrogenase family protein [Planctomycetaceae bacterium]
MTSPSREQQIQEAEEILGDRLQAIGFAKGLFFGQYRGERLLAYPQFDHDERTDDLVERLREFCAREVDPVAIDRQAMIPESVVRGLGQLGVLGACLPKSCGGMELSQTAYCRVLEVLGGHCGSTALFVNAHHSIGPRALVLFGTEEQKRRWLPKLATGEWISAFALTEPEAGSDAANVQSTATPTPDGSGFVINGQKRWITNGGLAQVLTVMARTPSPNGKESKITAFLVTPDMPGFQVVEKRMEKLGVRGTATSRLAFQNMFVPRENVLGQLGKGLKVALTVLDFGRTTFGASCTGAAKFCVARAVDHANRRVQFGQTLGSFELVKEKLAFMQAGTFAMEACTYQTAALIDSGEGDFMLETAMLKVFATETLWRILNDTFQLHGGTAYFTDQPFERMLRDARINTIGEGANDVLRAFTALVGMRDVGLELKGVLDAISHPLGNLTRLGRFAGRKMGSLLVAPSVAVRSTELESEAAVLGKLIGKLGANVERLLRTYQMGIVDRQYQLGRVADAVTEIYVSACVLNRLDALVRNHHGEEADLRMQLETGRYYLTTAERRVRRALADLWDNDDAATTSLANRMLKVRS